MGVKGNIATITEAHRLRPRAKMGLNLAIPGTSPASGEYATLLEHHGFEVAFATTFDRWTRLEHPERGLREWLDMFAGPWFEGHPRPGRAEAYRRIEERVRGKLWRDAAWSADYKRLRVLARAGR